MQHALRARTSPSQPGCHLHPALHPPSLPRRHELLTWQLPWGTTNPWQLVNHVLAGGRLEVPPREALPGPDTAAFAGLDAYISLMQRCWAQDPVERPAFQQIVTELRWGGVQVGTVWIGAAAEGRSTMLTARQTS